MSTPHDLDLANNAGATFRGDLNDALVALGTLMANPTAPTITHPNMWWMDTTTSLLKRRDNGDTKWIIVDTMSDVRVLNKVAAYTVLIGDHNKLIEANSDSGAFSLTLPAVATADGMRFQVECTGTSGNAVTIDPNASEQVNGAATLALNDGENAWIWCDGTDWRAVVSNSTAGTLTQTKGLDVVSAAALPVNIPGNIFDVTVGGVTTITSIASKGVGTVIVLQCDGELTFQHNATDLILPGARDYTTAAGDVLTFVEYQSGDWYLASDNRRPIEYQLLDSQTASASAQIDLETGITSAYSSLEIHVRSLVLGTTNRELFIRVGTGAGPTYQLGATDYSSSGLSMLPGSSGGIGSNTASTLKISDVATTGSPISGIIKVLNHADASNETTFQYHMVHTVASGMVAVIGAGKYNSTTVVTGIRLQLTNSALISSGEFRVYGVIDA